MNETIAETNFVSGMYVNGKVVDVLVAFSDQETIGCYGYSDKYFGVVIAMETWYFEVGQCTDNVLQHELSHLYWAPRETIKDLNCVMSEYLVYIVPGYYWLPTTLTNNWCDDCKSTINANKTLWGTPHEGGGGGGLRYFDTYSAPNGNCSE